MFNKLPNYYTFILSKLDLLKEKMEEIFKAEKVSRTATIELDAHISKVFPLFGAFEERKWADGWNPEIIYPSAEIIEEGTTFRTAGNEAEEKEFLWIVIKYEPKNYLIQYLVSTKNRFWTILIKCEQLTENLTTAIVTYTYTGLNRYGNDLNLRSLEKRYKENLTDWQQAINDYLREGKVAKNN